MLLVAVFISATSFIFHLMLNSGVTLDDVLPDVLPSSKPFWVGFVLALPLLLLFLITIITHPQELFQGLGSNLYRTSRGFLRWPETNSLNFLAVLLVLILVGLLVGWVLQMVWRSKWWVKIIVALVYVAAAAFFGLFLDFFNTKICISKYDHRNYCQTEACEIFVADAVGIRQVGERYIDGISYLLSYTDNGGQNWRLIVRSGKSLGPSVDCSQIGGLDARFFWTSLGDGFIFTHDGGKSWQAWTPRMLSEKFVYKDYSGYGEITDITFSDSKIGSMVLVDTCECDTKIRRIYLSTDDGGINWQIAQSENGEL